MSRKGRIGVVLCGGESRRMGFPKAFLPIAGMPLFQWLARRLESVSDEVILSVRDPRMYRRTGWSVIPDEKPGQGPLGGIVSCLRARPGQDLLVVPCDTPFVDPLLLSYLSLFAEVRPVVVPAWGRRVEPLVGCYAATAREPLEEYLTGGRRDATGFLDRGHALRVPLRETVWTGCGADLFRNLNRPRDLAALLTPHQEEAA